MVKMFALITLAFLMAAGLAACGSDNDEQEPTRPTTTPSTRQSPTATPSTPAGDLDL